MPQDLTVGSPSKTLLKFSLPLLLSTALQQIYSIADSVIVGRYTGTAGLAAIGAGYPITLIFVAIATGGSMGCSVVISRLFGAKELGRTRTAAETALLALSLLGVVLAALGVALAGPILRLMNAHGELWLDASVYLRIYAVGVLPMLVYNAANAVFTGLGDSRRPLYFLMLSSALNIVLDIYAVASLGLGVAGAAWATAISQAVSAVLAVLVILRQLRKMPAEPRRGALDGELLGEMTRLGLPAIFQQATVALAHTAVQSMINVYDTAVVAGYEMGGKVNTVIYSCLNTLGTALSTYVSQSLGAKKYANIRDGARASWVMCLAVSLVIIALAELFPAQVIMLFLGKEADPLAMDVGVSFLRIIMPLYMFISVIIAGGGLLRGMGHTMSFFLSTVAEIVVRVGMCWLVSRLMGSYLGIFLGWIAGPVTGAILAFWLWRKVLKKEVLPYC